MSKPFSLKIFLSRVAFAAAVVLACFDFITPPIALIAGFGFSLLIGHPFPELNRKATNVLLKISVIGLGFGMNFQNAMHTSKEGFVLTFATIGFTLVLSLLLGKFLRVPPKTSHLLGSGTAICGGSAIAAIGPLVNADDKDMSVSLATIFVLNSFALFLFPIIGHALELTQQQFGLWSAVAIHDTSSVVGASSVYGDEALQIATTVKLARALWIIPLALVTAFLFKADSKTIAIPWFIFLFIAAMLMNTYIPFVDRFNDDIVKFSRTGLTITLFLIGAGLTLEKLKSVGWKPLLLGIILWVVISVSSLTYIVLV